jgi:acetyl-CoA acetyltransferase
MTKGSGLLRNKYAIVGIGETEFSRNSGRTTRAMGAEAIRNAIDDSGLDYDSTSWGITCYAAGGDAASSDTIASDVGIRLDWQADTGGGGSSTETLIPIALGVLEAGEADAVIIYRSMNGRTGLRMGGNPPTGVARLAPWMPMQGQSNMYQSMYGIASPLNMFSMAAVRHMYEYGTTPEQLAHVKVAHSWGASNNPKAYYKQRYTVEDVINSRYMAAPFHLLDCCVETDNAIALIVTDIERAKDLPHPPVAIKGAAGRAHKWRPDYHWNDGPVNQVAGVYTKDIVFANAGVGQDDIDATGSYDAFTLTAMLQLEAYGFCEIGEGGTYVSDGSIFLGGKRPNNTSGGHLCETYTHGMNMVNENVRQLRGEVDDYCPNWQNGEHTYDYSEGGCRALRDPKHTMNLGWAQPATASALILTNDF